MMLKNSGKLVDCIVGVYVSFFKWFAVRSEPLLVEDDVMHLKKYPEEYRVPYPDQRQTEYKDVPDRGWDTFKKGREETIKYDYVFPGWWSSSRLLGLMGVPDVCPCWCHPQVLQNPVHPLIIMVTALTTGNLPELSTQVRALSVLVLSTHGGLSYNAAMQVLL